MPIRARQDRTFVSTHNAGGTQWRGENGRVRGYGRVPPSDALAMRQGEKHGLMMEYLGEQVPSLQLGKVGVALNAGGGCCGMGGKVRQRRQLARSRGGGDSRG